MFYESRTTVFNSDTRLFLACWCSLRADAMRAFLVRPFDYFHNCNLSLAHRPRIESLSSELQHTVHFHKEWIFTQKFQQIKSFCSLFDVFQIPQNINAFVCVYWTIWFAVNRNFQMAISLESLVCIPIISFCAFKVSPSANSIRYFHIEVAINYVWQW